MTDSTNPITIVTGVTRGLGKATARALATRGWTVIGDGRDLDDLVAVGEEIEGLVAVPGDVSDPRHRQELLDTAIASGGLDLLINNASILGPSPQPRLDSYPLNVLRTVFEVNVMAPLALMQAALPLLRRRAGTIVNVVSDAATESYAGWGGYGSSKAALAQMTHILAAEEPDLAVYRYDPGDMNTRMHQEAFPGEDISDRPDPVESVPPLLALIEGRPPSGWYGVADFVLAT